MLRSWVRQILYIITLWSEGWWENRFSCSQKFDFNWQMFRVCCKTVSSQLSKVALSLTHFRDLSLMLSIHIQFWICSQSSLRLRSKMKSPWQVTRRMIVQLITLSLGIIAFFWGNFAQRACDFCLDFALGKICLFLALNFYTCGG